MLEPLFRLDSCSFDFPVTLGDLGLTSSGFSGAKNDLIAELKLSHTAGGISKLRQAQQRAKEEQEKENYRRFLEKFTMENFLEKVRQSFLGRP